MPRNAHRRSCYRCERLPANTPGLLARRGAGGIGRGLVITGLLTAALAGQAPLAPFSGSSVQWNHGVSFASADRATVVQLGGLLQSDGRFAPAASATPSFVRGMFIRRARPIVQARLARRFEFRYVPDFAGGVMNLDEASASVRILPRLAIVAGKMHAPVRLKTNGASASQPFPERSLVADLEPSYEAGMEVAGSAAAGGLNYEAGVFNGANDGTSGTFAHFGARELDARVSVQPFLHQRRGWWRDLGFALGGSRGTASGALPSFKSFSQAKFFTYAHGATAGGVRWRLTPSVYFYQRAFAALAEYARSAQTVRGPPGSAAVNLLHHQAWEATALYVLTGEKLGSHGVIPRHAFDPVRGHWGALELALRHDQLSLDPRVVALGLAAPGSSRTAAANGVAADWYFSADLKAVLGWERTVFDGGHGPRAPEQALIYCLQISLSPTLPSLR